MTTSNGLSENHDHHCWVTFSGINWRILYKIGDVLGVRSSYVEGEPSYTAALDLSNVDWPRYIAACEEWNKKYYP